jgi:two-component system response regulator HydG
MTDDGKILIVEDDEDVLRACRLLLKKHFSQVTTSNTPEMIPQLMADSDFDAIMLDMNFAPNDHSGRDGLKWLANILNADPMAVVVMITAFSSVDAAVEAMKLGAVDFVEKPWNNEKLLSTLKAAVRLRRAQSDSRRFQQQARILAEDLSRRHHPIIGESTAIKKVLDVVSKAAPTDANILILGESGTGKELVAREIHARSRRADEVFVSVDLGAITETLLESELFGHRKGAFTGAADDRMGRFQAANGGTFFLDEIGNLPLSAQSKLLTVLENREVTPLGDVRPQEIDIRLISATNVDMSGLKDNAEFRQDLLYRLNTVEIQLPPLRERVDDIPLLANSFLNQYSRKFNRPVTGFGDDAMSLLMSYSWPGNIRELRYSIERAVILFDGDELQASDFSALRDEGGRAATTGQHRSLEQIEESTIRDVLQKHDGNISYAAKELGITRTSLYRRIKKYEI